MFKAVKLANTLREVNKLGIDLLVISEMWWRIRVNCYQKNDVVDNDNPTHCIGVAFVVPKYIKTVLFQHSRDCQSSNYHESQWI